jgi:hypothetical protein
VEFRDSPVFRISISTHLCETVAEYTPATASSRWVREEKKMIAESLKRHFLEIYWMKANSWFRNLFHGVGFI